MELSEASLGGVALLGDGKTLSDAGLNDLLKAVAADLTSAEPANHAELVQTESLANVSSAVLKEAYAAVVVVLEEAARLDVDAAAFSAFLEDNKVPASRAEVVTALYGNVKVILRQLLARNTSPWPHVTDVQWRLDYNVKDNHIDKLNKLNYLINLHTEDNDGKQDKIQLSCTVEQLQDLVNSLKDASKAVQSLAQ